MSFKNYWTDWLETLYRKCKSIHPLCLWNCVFENQEIEITYKNYSSLNTWAMLMKQKLNYSQYVEQEQDIFRYVKNSELTRGIRCHSDWIFPLLHQCYQWYSAPPPPPPPLSNYVLFLAILPEFSKMLLLNYGMSAISDCPFILLFVRFGHHLNPNLHIATLINMIDLINMVAKNCTRESIITRTW